MRIYNDYQKKMFAKTMEKCTGSVTGIDVRTGMEYDLKNSSCYTEIFAVLCSEDAEYFEIYASRRQDVVILIDYMNRLNDYPVEQAEKEVSKKQESREVGHERFAANSSNRKAS